MNKNRYLKRNKYADYYESLIKTYETEITYINERLASGFYWGPVREAFNQRKYKLARKIENTMSTILKYQKMDKGAALCKH